MLGTWDAGVLDGLSVASITSQEVADGFLRLVKTL